MKVVAIEKCFIDGGYRLQGEVFDYAGNPKKMSKALKKFDGESANDGDKDKGDDKGPTKAEIIAQLESAGVEYPKAAKRDELLEILKGVVEKAAGRKIENPDDLGTKTE